MSSIEFEVVEQRPGFWAASYDGVKRFGTTPNAARVACKRALDAREKAIKPLPEEAIDALERSLALDPMPVRKSSAKREPPKLPPMEMQSEPIEVVRKPFKAARFRKGGVTITEVVGVNAKHVANVQSACSHPVHLDTCACSGFRVQRPNGHWTVSMSRKSTIAFCKLNGWEWKLVPRDPIS